MKTLVLSFTLISVILLLSGSVQAQLPGCHAKFTFEVDEQNLTVTFNDSSWYDVGPQNTTWFWDFGDGNYSQNQNAVHTYSVPETYEICLTVTNCSSIPGACCSDTYCDTIQWGKYVPTLSDATSEEEAIHLFPNPFSSSLTIQLSPRVREVVIYEVSGRELIRYPVIEKVFILETGFLPDGMYAIGFSGEGTVVANKLLIKN